jgi:hypothetical protein
MIGKATESIFFIYNWSCGGKSKIKTTENKMCRAVCFNYCTAQGYIVLIKSI